MLDRNKFEIEREQFLKAFCEKITFILGLEMNAKFNEARFYRFTDIAFELANFGTMDNFLGFDEFDLVAFVETMETMLPTVANNMNIEEEYPTLTTAVSCLGLYSSLYIVRTKTLRTTAKFPMKPWLLFWVLRSARSKTWFLLNRWQQ